METLVSHLADDRLSEVGVIGWAQPVAAFGNPGRSRMATLGLNPSNLEFEDDDGRELIAPANRFETLTSLELPRWSASTRSEIERVWLSCQEYFLRRPYHRWFRPLDRIINRAGASYYCEFSSACHLDLVPFATKKKWSVLNSMERDLLLSLGVPSFVRTLGTSDVRVIVLNGASVVKAVGDLLDKPLQQCDMRGWALGRRGNKAVIGKAYWGTITRLGRYPLDRELLVLGYNHNIQSSFGVTGAVIDRIGAWIARRVAETLG
jgi:hypothetical protein